jgi:hypothetical protein
MEVHLPVAPPGVVKPEEREILGLTPEEGQRMDNALTGYFARLYERIQSSLYETNRPTLGRIPQEVRTGKVFVVPPLGNEVGEAAEQLFAEMRAALGDDRWGLMKRAFEINGTRSLREIMGLDAVGKPQEVAVWIKQKENEAPTVEYSWSSGHASHGRSGLALSQFNPGQAQESAGTLNVPSLPDTVLNRITSWLGEEAMHRAPDSSKP